MKLEKGSTIKLNTQDIIVDLPPKAESLKKSVTVYIPVMYDSYEKNATATCGKGENGEYLRANVTIGQTFRGNSSKFNLAHILRLGRP